MQMGIGKLTWWCAISRESSNDGLIGRATAAIAQEKGGRGAGIMAGGEVKDPLTLARRCEHVDTFRHLGRSFKWPSFVWHEGRCEWPELAARRALVRQRQHFLKSPGTY